MDDAYDSADSSIDTGSFGNVIMGSHRCQQYADGTMEKPRGICWVILCLLMLSYVPILIDLFTQPTDDRRVKGYILGAIGLAVGALSFYVFYKHCLYCNGVPGFCIAVFLSAVWWMISYSIVPFRKELFNFNWFPN